MSLRWWDLECKIRKMSRGGRRTCPKGGGGGGGCGAGAGAGAGEDSIAILGFLEGLSGKVEERKLSPSVMVSPLTPPILTEMGVTEAERINSSARILDLFIYFYIYRWLGVLKNAFSRSTYYQEMSMLNFF